MVEPAEPNQSNINTVWNITILVCTVEGLKTAVPKAAELKAVVKAVHDQFMKTRRIYCAGCADTISTTDTRQPTSFIEKWQPC
jgi:hypothetical protein